MTEYSSNWPVKSTLTANQSSVKRALNVQMTQTTPKNIKNHVDVEVNSQVILAFERLPTETTCILAFRAVRQLVLC